MRPVFADHEQVDQKNYNLTKQREKSGRAQ